jgi:hypothetical protein
MARRPRESRDKRDSYYIGVVLSSTFIIDSDFFDSSFLGLRKRLAFFFDFMRTS